MAASCPNYDERYTFAILFTYCYTDFVHNNPNSLEDAERLRRYFGSVPLCLDNQKTTQTSSTPAALAAQKDHSWASGEEISSFDRTKGKTFHRTSVPHSVPDSMGMLLKGPLIAWRTSTIVLVSAQGESD